MGTIKLDKNGNALGTSRADTIKGNGKTNIIDGRGGNDTIRGLGGHDLIDGFSGNDRIYGDSGNDVLSGGAGRDILTGGAGFDFFAFEAKLSRSAVDTITDFSVRKDTILLWTGIFKIDADANGAISAGAFWTGSKAHDADDRIIYNKKTGALSYDSDGAGSKAAIQFASLDKGLRMSDKDFIIF